MSIYMESVMTSPSAAVETPSVPVKKAATPGKAAAAKPATKPSVKAAAKPAVKATLKTAPKSKPRTAAKPKVKGPGKPAAKPAAKAAPVTVSSTDKSHVAVVRDSFTMTAHEEALLKQCKRDAIALGRETKKSEVLRAAIQHFVKLSAAERNAAYAALDAIKTGRPKKAKR
jgi:predicted transcriptional regulator